MSRGQIENVIARFTRAARLAFKTGFHGVEVHEVHAGRKYKHPNHMPISSVENAAKVRVLDGFLLFQFLSPSANNRSDEFEGPPDKRVEVVLSILRAIRKEVPSSFCVGIEINSADHMKTGGLEEMLRQIELISVEQVVYINLSGGSFEDPQVRLANSLFDSIWNSNLTVSTRC